MPKNEVPFYSNTGDGMHCVQASFRSMLKYFMPDKDYTWAELDAMSKKEPGKGTWWFPLLLEIQKMGMEITDISNFNLQRYYEQGEAYLRAAHSEEVANWMLERSNLVSVKKYIPSFLRAVDFQNRRATLDDLKILLNEGWLVGVDLNSRTLNDKAGYSSHMVVVFDAHHNTLWLHDPGLPPQQNREVSEDLFIKAWEYGGTENTSLVALRRTGQGACAPKDE